MRADYSDHHEHHNHHHHRHRRRHRPILGSLSNYYYDDDDNFKKTIGLMIKTKALHVHHDYDVKHPNLTFYGGRGHTTTNFASSF